MAPGTRCLIGDMGYDADWIRQDLLLRGVLPVVPSNPARTAPLPLDRELYRLRNRIERLNNKLKQFRAVVAVDLHARHRLDAGSARFRDGPHR